MRRTTSSLPASLLAFAAVAACGGSVETTASDGGRLGGDATSTGTPPKPPRGGGAEDSSPGVLSREDGSCSTSTPTFSPPDSSSTCWSCIEKGCPMEFAACASDCVCNDAIAGSVSCVNAGGEADCFHPSAGSGNDGALSALNLCVLQTSAECPCGSGPPDAGTGCVETGGSGAAGNGQCTSDFSEKCGSTSYQVVCACPAGSCACFSDEPDAGTKVFTFAGCPYCPGGPGPNSSRDLFSLCGFPVRTH